MENKTNTVLLDVRSYNQTKAEIYRLNMVLENILQNATLSEDCQSLVFDSNEIKNALQFCYLDRYKKKLSTLKTQNTRYGGITR